MRLGKLIKYSSIGVAAAAKSALTGKKAREYLIESLLDQPGLPAKVAQLIAMRSGVDTPPGTSPDMPLRMSLTEVRQRIEADTPALAREIDEISETARVASLSQVHEARLKSGERVAIKVQFPGLADEIAHQVDDFIDLAARSPARAYGFSRETWGAFLREKLLEEINYRVEARYQNEFRSSVRTPWMVVPRVHDIHSCATILTQSFEPSVSPTGLPAMRGSLGRRHLTDAATMTTEILARSIFQANLIHCDLNPGNYGFRFSPDSGSTSLVLYDFGSMQRLSNDQVRNLARMIARACGEIDDDWMALLAALGFDTQKLQPLADRLHRLMPALLEPFRARDQFDPEAWHPGKMTDEIAGGDKWWLRTAGPPWFLYLMRTVQGWHHGMKLIGQPIPTRRIFEEFMAPALASSTPPRAPVHSQHQPGATESNWLSEFLHVRVSDGRETIIDLKMPAAAIENLGDLIPEDVARRIESQGHDLRKMARDLVAARGPRGMVFEASHGARQYRVWLD